MEIVASRPCFFNRQMGIISVSKNSLLWKPDGHSSDTLSLSYEHLQGTMNILIL